MPKLTGPRRILHNTSADERQRQRGATLGTTSNSLLLCGNLTEGAPYLNDTTTMLHYTILRSQLVGNVASQTDTD